MIDSVLILCNSVFSTVLVISTCLSVFCPSDSCVVSKWLNFITVLSWPGGFVILVSWTQMPSQNSKGNTLNGAWNRSGLRKFCNFQPVYRCVLEMVKERGIIYVNRKFWVTSDHLRAVQSNYLEKCCAYHFNVISTRTPLQGQCLEKYRIYHLRS